MHFLRELYQASQASMTAHDLVQRAVMPVLGIVTDNNDPKGNRRIKYTSGAAPGLSSDWTRRLQVMPGYDPPLPPVGATVLILSIDGIETNQFYLHCVNDTNPPHDKPSSRDDLHSSVPGSQVVDVGETLTLKNKAGASITLEKEGDVVIEDASGNKITLSGGISFNTGSLQVGDKEITTLGAKDSEGNTLVTRGW